MRSWPTARAVHNAPTHEAGEAQTAELIERCGVSLSGGGRELRRGPGGLALSSEGAGAPPDRREDDQPLGEELPRGAAKDEGDPAPAGREERDEERDGKLVFVTSIRVSERWG